MKFLDRKEAGQKLVPKLQNYKDDSNAILLALPRGGVVTAFELAKELHLPLDIVVPRKIGAPGNPEFAIGAITEDGEGIFDQSVINQYEIPKEYLDTAIKKETKEAQRRLKEYRGSLPPRELKGKTAILVDDGIATGRTMLAAIKSVKSKGAAKIVVAVPVSSKDSLKKVQAEVDETICLGTPFMFMAVGQFYEIFPQNTDEEVIKLMKKANT